MADAVGSVRVTGQVEAARALHDLGPDVQQASDEASHKIAGMVATAASSAARSIGGVAAHVAPSIRAEDAGVAVGGSGWPMAEGAASGANQYAQFKPYVGSYGYFPYPQADKAEDRAVHEYDDAIDHVIKRRFPQ